MGPAELKKMSGQVRGYQKHQLLLVRNLRSKVVFLFLLFIKKWRVIEIFSLIFISAKLVL